MAVAFRSAATGAVTDSAMTTYTVPRPANVADGDLLILMLSQVTTNTNTYMALPAGFTAGTPITFPNDTVDWARWGWKFASSEPASYTFQSESGRWATCSILAFTGVDPISPFSAPFADWVLATPASTVKTTPSVTPDDVGVYVVRLAMSGKATPGPASAVQTWTPPAGHTELLDYAGAGAHLAHTAAGLQWPGYANTATGTADFTLSSAQTGSWGTTVALRPTSPAPKPAGGFTRVQAASNGGVVASLSVTLGKAPTPGNLLVCWWGSGSACTLTNSGWTAGPRVDANVGSAMYYKIATAADTSVTFTLTRNDVTAGLIEYAGNTAAPFDKQATSSVVGDNGALSITAVSAQTTAPSDLVVCLAALRASVTAGYPTNPTWTGGLTNVLAQGDGQSGASNVTCYSYYGDNLDAGAAGTTSIQATWSTTQFKQRTGLAMTFKVGAAARTVNKGAFFAFS